MNGLVYCCVLLADARTRLEYMSRGFRPSSREDELRDVVLGLAVLAGLAAALWILARLMEWREQARPVNRPLGLFLALCRAHRLSWSDRWFLWRIAASQGLRDPGRLFLEPERLEPAHLPTALRSRAAQARRLRNQLFSAPEPSSPSEQTAARRTPQAPLPTARAIPVEPEPFPDWMAMPWPAAVDGEEAAPRGDQ